MVTIKILEATDLQHLVNLIDLYHEVFDMQTAVVPKLDYLQSLLDKPGLTFLVAIENNSVIGGLTAHDLPSIYFESNEIYVYDLAVSTSHRRQGIGTRMLTELGKICESKKYPEYFLQADFDDADAIDFYRSIEAIEQQAVHFSFNTKTNSG